MQRADCVKLCGRAASEPSDLREDEPHPVALFFSALQLGQRNFENAVLRIDEALQLEWVGAFDHPVRVIGRLARDQRSDANQPVRT